MSNDLYIFGVGILLVLIEGISLWRDHLARLERASLFADARYQEAAMRRQLVQVIESAHAALTARSAVDHAQAAELHETYADLRANPPAAEEADEAQTTTGTVDGVSIRLEEIG